MILAFDTETELIEPGSLAPRLACLSLARRGRAGELFGRRAAADIIESYLDDLDCTIVGHNAAYDFGVLGCDSERLVPKIFEAYLAGRVRDTMVREQLVLIREGKAIDEKRPSLASLAEKYLGFGLEKVEGWRFWFGDLMAQPLDRWPQAARDYALGDADATLRVFEAQGPDLVSPDEILQTRAFWCLHLMSLWGFRTDGAEVARLRSGLEKDLAEAEARLLEMTLLRIAGSEKKPKVSKDTKAIMRRVELELGDRAPRTPTGKISIAAEVLESCRDEGLQLVAAIANKQKKLGTFVPLVEQGVRGPVTPSWNGLVRSGRTSCGREGDGNWQNLERDGQIRACVIPRPGTIFINADVAQGELCTLAQACLDWFGASPMADALNAGRDLHVDLACSTPSLLGGHATYEEAMRLKKLEACEGSCGHEECGMIRLVGDKRQFAKVANFGFPGGLGADTFVEYAWALARIRTTSEEGGALKRAWLEKWAMQPYFDKIARLVEAGDPLEQPRSGRLRGGLAFCAAANSAFQGLLADAMKEAMWQIALKCYFDESSALFGSRPILFLHDEFIAESPEDRAAEAAEEMSSAMVWAMGRFCPGVKKAIKAEPRLMRRWYKGAKEKRDERGRLIPWEPKRKEAK